jgi:uncharacterized membrane protein YgdD (TMEM256/DUF423 family)
MTGFETSHDRRWLAAGALLAGLGVGLGAFGAHGLRSIVTADLLQAYETGVRYHLIHSLAIIASALAADRFPWAGSLFRRGAAFFAAGILLFSGSLYLLVVTGNRLLGIVTPFGGVSFLIGWLLFALAALRKP